MSFTDESVAASKRLRTNRDSVDGDDDEIEILSCTQDGVITYTSLW